VITNEDSLFRQAGTPETTAPLAERMRPADLSEVVGQRHILGPGKALQEVIEQGIPVSMIFWGPPGSGKTTLARLVALKTRAVFLEYSAVLSGVKQIREVIERARLVRGRSGRQTILFIDEIHRFNKIQQDAFLPHVENGHIVLVGATTENPSFEVIPALLSRCRVFVLKPLDRDALKTIVLRAMTHTDRGLGTTGLTLADDAVDFLVDSSAGDARVALGTLELAAQLAPGDPPENRIITLDHLVEVQQTRPARYDKSGDAHFDMISAFHKSIRGSDPDAALYWMSRMLDGGEDPLYIARRLLRIASEDVGLADPQALSVVVAARQIYDMLGSPEGELAIAEAAVYLAVAPKSNTMETAFDRARECAGETADLGVPMHIRNAPTRLMKEAGYGRGYIYDHSVPGGYAGQEFLPEPLQGRRFYEPRQWGFEREIARRMEWYRRRKSENQKRVEKEAPDD